MLLGANPLSINRNLPPGCSNCTWREGSLQPATEIKYRPLQITVCRRKDIKCRTGKEQVEVKEAARTARSIYCMTPNHALG